MDIKTENEQSLKAAKLPSHVITQTAKKNLYIMDMGKKKTLLGHPVMVFFLELTNRGENIDTWMQEWKDDQLQLESYGVFPRKVVEYYYRKYLMLKDNGYFSALSPDDRISLRMTPEMVESALGNLSQLVFETTDQCCLECKYCGYGEFYQKYEPRTNRFLDIKTSKVIIDYLLELLNSNVNRSHERVIYISFYGGEPLMNFSMIRDTVEYAESLNWKHNKYKFSMTTNAILLEKYMDFLVQHDFNLLISLDGDEFNNQYRVHKNGKPAYNEIIRNINALRDKYPDYFARKVNFNAVLHNKNSVEAIHQYFKTHFNKIPSIGPLNNSGIREEYVEEFKNMYVNPTESLYKSENYRLVEKEMFINLSSIRELAIFFQRYNDSMFDNYRELLNWKLPPKGFPTGTCMPFAKKLFVTVGGNILCCERIDQEFILGKIEDGKVILDCKQIADRYNEWFDKLRRICSHCYNVEQCTQCIFYLDIKQKNPQCYGFTGIGNFSGYLSSIMGYLENNPEIYSRIIKKTMSN